MKHADVVRHAIATKTPIYALVREMDGYVYDEGPYTVKLFTDDEFRKRLPVAPHWRWVSVDPYDPSALFELDDRGAFWHRP